MFCLNAVCNAVVGIDSANSPLGQHVMAGGYLVVVSSGQIFFATCFLPSRSVLAAIGKVILFGIVLLYAVFTTFGVASFYLREHAHKQAQQQLAIAEALAASESSRLVAENRKKHIDWLRTELSSARDPHERAMLNDALRRAENEAVVSKSRPAPGQRVDPTIELLADLFAVTPTEYVLYDVIANAVISVASQYIFLGMAIVLWPRRVRHTEGPAVCVSDVVSWPLVEQSQPIACAQALSAPQTRQRSCRPGRQRNWVSVDARPTGKLSKAADAASSKARIKGAEKLRSRPPPVTSGTRFDDAGPKKSSVQAVDDKAQAKAAADLRASPQAPSVFSLDCSAFDLLSPIEFDTAHGGLRTHLATRQDCSAPIACLHQLAQGLLDGFTSQRNPSVFFDFIAYWSRGPPLSSNPEKTNYTGVPGAAFAPGGKCCQIERFMDGRHAL